MQCAAVTMCVASMIVPVQRNRPVEVWFCTNAAHGALCTWIGVPPVIGEAIWGKASDARREVTHAERESSRTDTHTPYRARLRRDTLRS